MTLTFLDLYNSAASQEWSMFDNDATKTEDFEKSLVIDLNKAVKEILYSYPFKFREKTHVILTVPKVKSYSMPHGLICKDNNGSLSVNVNSKKISLIKNPFELTEKLGVPEGFYIRGSKIVLYPTPAEKYIVTIDYLTLAVGENGDENIFALQNDSDIISVPEYLEEIFKDAVISRAMLNSIASESDENYSAYKKQSEIAYKMLVKYSKGMELDKTVKI